MTETAPTVPAPTVPAPTEATAAGIGTIADEPIRIRRIDGWAVRQPIERPVATSFGVMRDRPAVFVRVEDAEGAYGWGEIFANWPAAGAEHRVNLLMLDIADLVFRTPIVMPSDLFYRLQSGTRLQALQSGEWGPFQQVTAGLDTAVWDLFARRAGLPLRRLLNPSAADRVPAYASGIPLRDATEMIGRARAIGFGRFKVKIGFDLNTEIDAVPETVDRLHPGEQLFTDANQAWSPSETRRFLDGVAGSALGWLEEPIPADSPEADWAELASSTVPLAGGENIAGFDAFSTAIECGPLSVFQPDVAKWGGVTGCMAVGRTALAAGRRYCPHFLGGGIGLAASGHLLAAVGGDGLLEVDVNPNDLRDGFGSIGECMSGGKWVIPDGVGLGVNGLPGEFESLVTLARTRSQ